jgi:hypothetical protein
MTVKQWYTAAQLAGMPGLPVTPSGVVRRARIDGWVTRRRVFGKGLEYRVVPGPDWPLITRDAPRPQQPAPAVNTATPRQWYSAAQLAGMPGLPRTRQGVLVMAKREEWPSRRRAHGKGMEYRVVAVPAETLRALLAGDDHG